MFVCVPQTSAMMTMMMCGGRCHAETIFIVLFVTQDRDRMFPKGRLAGVFVEFERNGGQSIIHECIMV